MYGSGDAFLAKAKSLSISLGLGALKFVHPLRVARWTGAVPELRQAPYVILCVALIRLLLYCSGSSMIAMLLSIDLTTRTSHPSGTVCRFCFTRRPWSFTIVSSSKRKFDAPLIFIHTISYD